MNNIQLQNLYTDFFSENKLSEETGRNCSLPLLIKIPEPELWESSPRRLLIVGQETQKGWGDKKGYHSMYRNGNPGLVVQQLMDKYESFAFAQNEPRRNSPFWTAFKELGDPKKGNILWSNIFRFDYNCGSVMNGTHKKPCERLEIYEAQHGLLKQEIDLLRPTAVIFFTGRLYDEALGREFQNCELKPVTDFTENEFARVITSDLKIPAYRLYHPSYIRRKKRWNVIMPSLKEMLKDEHAQTRNPASKNLAHP